MSCRVDFIRSIQYMETFQRDEEDALTEEEIRETEEMLQAEKDMRKAQGQQNDAARKADNEYRKANPDALRLAEQAGFEKQAELQIEQERLAERARLADTILPAGPLAMPSTNPTSGTHVPGTPRPRGAAAPLPAGSVGRPRNIPNTTPRVVGRDQDGTPRSAPPVSRPTAPVPTPRSGLSSKPGPAPPSHPAPPPPPPPIKNRFNLSVSQGLPRIFVRPEKDSSDKNGENSDEVRSKAKEAAPVGTLRLEG